MEIVRELQEEWSGLITVDMGQNEELLVKRNFIPQPRQEELARLGDVKMVTQVLHQILPNMFLTTLMYRELPSSPRLIQRDDTTNR